ncbi:MAG TPA: 50S ribosomal protein L11 methyltransferase, partial [Dehalococcoidia bacterium]|nr:50S ribosomal protein L11 methyltransferase [Dehalococcoidia bacterium]
MTATAARYLQLTVTVAGCDAEAAAGVLRDITKSGLWVEHPFTQADLETDAAVDPSQPARIHAYVSGERAATDWMREVRAGLGHAGVQAAVESRYVAEEQWADAWKEHFHVERYGRIVVVPSWRAFDPQPGDVTLTLDPGMAFGTGQHETTRMCLEALDRHVRPGMRVLDVGSGSGILAVAAARLGAR